MIRWGEKQLAVLRRPFTHCLEVNEGTPRSGKSTVDVARFASFVWQSQDQNHLVLAYSQEQAYKLVMDCDGFGLTHIFPSIHRFRHDNDFGSHMELQTPNGLKRIYYKGGGKADSHKAFVGLSLGSVYFCEIDLLHIDAVNEAFRRTFASRNRWHIADLNPPAPMHPIIKEVFDVQDTLWTHWTIEDNPIISPERKEEIRQVCLKNPYLYKRDWLGERSIPEGVIYSMFDMDKHILRKIPKDFVPLEMFFAGDGGLTDATSVSCYIVGTVMDKPIMLRMANWYYGGQDMAMSVQAGHLVREFAPYCRRTFGMREEGWYIDPACKALRKEIELYGILTTGADNNGHDVKGNRKGIEVGIEYCQSAITDGRFFLIENDTYGHYDFIKEIGMYCVDGNGHPVDANNHCMDEFRYANNHFYKRYVLN